MAQCTVTITVHVAWWVRPYINSIRLFCGTFGTEPDMDKVMRTIMRGITVKPS